MDTKKWAFGFVRAAIDSSHGSLVLGSDSFLRHANAASKEKVSSLPHSHNYKRAPKGPERRGWQWSRLWHRRPAWSRQAGASQDAVWHRAVPHHGLPGRCWIARCAVVLFTGQFDAGSTTSESFAGNDTQQLVLQWVFGLQWMAPGAPTGLLQAREGFIPDDGAGWTQWFSGENAVADTWGMPAQHRLLSMATLATGARQPCLEIACTSRCVRFSCMCTSNQPATCA